jgi:hypothetical protein
MFKQSKVLGMVVAILMIVFVGYAYADDVTDAVNEALQHYKGGNYSEALSITKSYHRSLNIYWLSQNITGADKLTHFLNVVF